MFWYIIILCMFLLPMSIVIVGYNRKINTDRLVIPTCSIILLFFMACRSINIGADTKQYVYGFKQVCEMNTADLFKSSIFGIGKGYELNFEYGYRLFNKIISVFSTNEQTIIIANSLLIIILLSVLIKKQSLFPFLSFWLYITLGIFQTQMNMSRNAIAILVCYIGFRYIKENNIIKYALFVIVGTFFHSSSILFVPVFWLVKKVKLSTKLLKILIVVAIVLGFSFSVIRPYLVRLLPFGLGRYFSGNTTKFESLVVGVFHLVLLMFSWMMIDKKERPNVIKNDYIGIWMIVNEIFFFCVGYDVSSATRMAALFGPYLIVLIPNILVNGIKSKKKRLTAIFIIILFTGIQYVLRLSINNIGSTMPYQFFWANSL